jgi:organic radical activating enzyme
VKKIERPGFRYHMTEHCNLTCHGCDTGAPLLAEKVPPFEQFQSDIAALATVFHAKEMRFSGGEPTLHPRLVDFVAFARESGIADRLVLFTNGVLLHKAPDRLWDLLDEVWLSVYPQVRLARSLEEFDEIARRHDVVFAPAFQNRFFTTLLNRRLEDPRLVQAIFQNCKMTGEYSCHTVYDGRYYKCSQAPLMGRRLGRIGIALDSDADGVPLDAPDLGLRLQRYLDDRRPLESCNYCLGSSGPQEDHRLLNRAGVEASRLEDHSAAIAWVTSTLPLVQTVTFDDGFYPEEGDDTGATWRWMGAAGCIKLRNTGRDMQLGLAGFTHVDGPAGTTIELEFSGMPLDRIVGVCGAVQLHYEVSAARQARDEWSTLRILNSRVFIPHEIDPRTPDRRRLGFAVKAVSWKEK